MKNNTVLKIVLAVILVGVLTVGGFSLYRLGLMQGAHAGSSPEFGGRLAPEFGEWLAPDFRAGGGPEFSFRGSGREGINLFRALPGLLIFTGVILFLGLGAILLSRRLLFKPQVPAGQPLPPAESPPATDENPENLE
jgi:hypothetical protein